MAFKAGKYAFIAVTRMLSTRLATFIFGADEEEIKVASTCLTRATFNKEEDSMTLTFTDGTVYRYTGVDIAAFESLREAASKGVYFNYNLRDQFPYERIG